MLRELFHLEWLQGEDARPEVLTKRETWCTCPAGKTLLVSVHPLAIHSAVLFKTSNHKSKRPAKQRY